MDLKSGKKKQPDHRTLIRDAVVFQFKLVVDGFRDLLLLPASFVATILSLVNSSDGKPGPQFYRLLGAGKRSERWIDLFAAYGNSPDDTPEKPDSTEPSIDDIVHRVESFVIDEHQRGGVTAQAKARLDKALETLRQRQSAGKSND
ncbi:MAG: hypothetical protein KJO82_07740 [Gammaproteobacteria bacterium]|nr:hypothetical protein [Gammaproteobacteria bacterium]NNC77289.1 hypothetical protein [Woeseiaceae bacterium]